MRPCPIAFATITHMPEVATKVKAQPEARAAAWQLNGKREKTIAAFINDWYNQSMSPNQIGHEQEMR